MNMNEVVEKSIFLRPFNYLRVKSEYTLLYAWIYPILLSAIILLFCVIVTPPPNMDLFDVLFDEISSMATILLPFYIASLAAVSTFAGAKFLDQPFMGRTPFTLKIRKGERDWDTLPLTPRNYLRLLFAYCTLSTLILIVLLFCEPVTSFAATKINSDLSLVVLATPRVLIVFLASQLCLTTIIGVYFLSDYLVRNDSN